jgi:phosphatidylglycerol lysyltransferase
MKRSNIKKRLFHLLLPLVSASLFVLALHVLFRELHNYNYRDVVKYFQQIPGLRLALAVASSLMSYLMLTFYDVLGLRYAGHALPYGKIAFTSYTGYAFSNSIGYSFLSGGAIRYRFYSAWGLSTLEIAKVIVFCFVTALLGYFTVAGIAFTIEGESIPSALHLPVHLHTARPLGVVFLTFVMIYFVLTMTMKKPFVVRKIQFAFPKPALALLQYAVSSLDWFFAAATIYLLLPPRTGISIFAFMGIYLLSQLAGSASQVPGGLGVFEVVMVLLLSSTTTHSQIVGALLSFRIIYYFMPLVIASLMFGSYELFQRTAVKKGAVNTLVSRVTAYTPQVFALLTFFGGSLLLFSGSIPFLPNRVQFISRLLSLYTVEVSHFLGSIVGLSLLLLALGLYKRLNSAYYAVTALLALGVVLSFLRGMRYGEAAVLSIILVVLIPSRKQFYRQTAFTEHRFSPQWAIAVVLVILTSIWLGLFSYRNVRYSGELWWQFSLHGDASRFLRASVGTAVVLLVFGISRLVRPAGYRPALPTKEQLERARAVVLNSEIPNARLALLGDKAFLFSRSGRSFIMYGVQARSWIGLGDPIGPEEEWRELILDYRILCSRYLSISVFYEIPEEHTALYRNLGLSLFKFGEEAWVNLPGFSMEGGKRSDFRHTINRVGKEGWTFEIVASENVHAIIPDLKRISDEWLAMKNAEEKGFSLGFFDTDYLVSCPHAVLRRRREVSAFVNILVGTGSAVFSLDLMRYGSNAPEYAMEFLFLKLIQWGKQKGYTWFNLGMVPLSGLEDDELSPVWDRIGTFIFRHGEHFYHFQGLREFKAKFDPVWKPRYLALPGGLALPRVLMDVAKLISKGRGIEIKDPGR